MMNQDQTAQDAADRATAPAITFGTELSIYEVDTTRQTMLTALAASSPGARPLTLDLAQLRECDGAGLQLLLALARSATENAQALAWNNVSPQLLDWFDSLGASAVLGTATARPAP